MVGKVCLDCLGVGQQICQMLSIKANPPFQLIKLSYLWIEAYLTDVAGNDRPLCLHHRWPKGVRHHSFLDRVHLKRDNPEVTSKTQQHGRNSEGSVSPNCSALKGSTKWMWMCEKGLKKCRWMTRGVAEEGESWEIKKSGDEWIEGGAVIDVDRRVCVFSAAAGAAVCAWVLGCCSNALIHAGVRQT